MAIDFTDFENTLQTKLDAVTDPKEMLLLGKAVESTIGNIELSEVLNFGDSNYARLDGTTFTGGVEEAVGTVTSNDFDLSTGNFFTYTATADATLTASNVAASGDVSSFVVEITDGGSYTLTYFSGITWPGGEAPTLTASGTDVLAFFTRDGGTTWRGFVLGLDVQVV